MLAQLDVMRDTINGHVATSLETLSEFMDDINTNTLILSSSAGNINNVVQSPRGELQARREIDSGVITFSATAFRAYCFKKGINYARIKSDLRRQNVLLGEGVLRTLGAQTPYATGQVRCFVVDQKRLGVVLTLATPQPITATRTGQQMP